MSRRSRPRPRPGPPGAAPSWALLRRPRSRRRRRRRRCLRLGSASRRQERSASRDSRFECEPSSPPRVCVPKSIPLAYPLTPDIGLPSHPDLPAASEKCAETCVETFQQRTQGCPMSISLTLGGSHPPRRKGIGSESLPIMGTNHHNLKRGVFHNNHPQSGLQRWSKS